MHERLVKIRDRLDRRARDRAADAWLRAEREADRQRGSRARLTWVVTVAGVGHGLREGQREVDAPPVVFYKVE